MGKKTIVTGFFCLQTSFTCGNEFHAKKQRSRDAENFFGDLIYFASLREPLKEFPLLARSPENGCIQIPSLLVQTIQLSILMILLSHYFSNTSFAAHT